MRSLEADLKQCFGSSATIEKHGPFGVRVLAKRPGEHLKLSPELVRDWTARTPLLLFRGFTPISRDELLGICVRNVDTELLHWDFGPVMELRVQPDPVNYLFSSEAVPYHWDGAFHRVPSYLVFNCLQAPLAEAGGETLFCDTTRIVEEADAAELESWKKTDLTYTTEKKAHYGGEFRVKMVGRHPKNGAQVLRYAEPVETELNPVSLKVAGAFEDRPGELVDQMRRKIYDPKYSYAHQWQDGDLLFADNHALIHGRHPFKAASPRHIRRVQIL